MARTRIDLFFSLCILLLVVWAVWEARDWPFRTRLFPWAVGFPVLGLALIQLFLALRHALSPQSEAVSENRPESGSDRGPDGATVIEAGAVGAEPKGRTQSVRDARVARRRGIGIMAWTVVFALGFWLFGFRVGATLLTFAFLRFQAHESGRTSAVLSIGTYLFFLVGLELALGIPMPAGLVATSLGLQALDGPLVNPALDTILRR